MVAGESVRLCGPLDMIPVEIDCRLDSMIHRLAGVLCGIICRVHGVRDLENTITTPRLLPAPSVERIGIPGDNGVARQCTPAGDALNDEQRGDHLPNPSLC